MKRILLLLTFIWVIIWADPYEPSLPSTDPWDTVSEGYEQPTTEPSTEFYDQTTEQPEGMHDYRPQTYEYSYELAPID